MMSKVYMQLSIMFCLCGYVSTSSPVSNVTTYVCTPEGIEVYNLPENSSFSSVQEDGNGTLCNVIEVNSTSVLITGCSQEYPVLFTYGTHKNLATLGIIGGMFKLVRIYCNDIPETGVVHKVNNTFGAISHGKCLHNMSHTKTSSMTGERRFMISTYEVKSSLNTTSASIGDPVAWTISFPSEYMLEVSNCTASPGADAASTDVVQLISSGGCQMIEELISSFTDNRDGSITAVIRAFKFYSEDSVLLQCGIVLCPNSTTSTCDTLCSRGKRSVRTSPETGFNYRIQIQNSLHVVDPYVGLYSSETPNEAVYMFVDTRTLTFLLTWLLHMTRALRL